jgi:hypothetical protein
MKMRTTEQLWLAYFHPAPLLKYMSRRASRRKIRLFACACARRVCKFLNESDSDSRTAIDASEDFADGLIPAERMKAIIAKAHGATANSRHVDLSAEYSASRSHAALSAAWAARGIATRASNFAMRAMEYSAWEGDSGTEEKLGEQESRAQLEIGRDIFANPFRLAIIDPDWLTWRDGTVVKLAQTIYSDRRFDIMPILGDALHEAGCCDEAILDHCRGPNNHVRGCWVVDLLLGKQ